MEIMVKKMAVSRTFEKFRVRYDELTDEVSRAQNDFIADHLRRWFENLDETPLVNEIIKRLESVDGFEEWFKKCNEEERLTLPASGSERLGLRLLLLRTVASGDNDAGMLGIDFAYVGHAGLNQNARSFMEQVFSPLTRELRVYLETMLDTNRQPGIPESINADWGFDERPTELEKYDSDFFEEYEQFMKSIDEANQFQWADKFADWFSFLDEDRNAGPAIHKLEGSVDFGARLADYRKRKVNLNWPKDHTQRLAMRLGFFRALSRNELSMVGAHFISGAGMIPRDLITKLFFPMSRDLLKYLVGQVEVAKKTVPAADRIVSRDDNSVVYDQAVAALDKLEHTLKFANVEIKDNDVRIAEVGAARRLFDALRVRAEPIVALLKPLVIQFGTKLKDTIVGAAVAAVMAALAALFGALFSALF